MSNNSTIIANSFQTLRLFDIKTAMVILTLKIYVDSFQVIKDFENMEVFVCV